MGKKQLYLLISTFIFVVILVGCNSEESESIDLFESYPTGVENGDVSKEYYHDLMSYMWSNSTYRNDFSEFLGEEDYYVQPKVEKFRELIIANSVNINSYNFVPVTDAEKEIDYYFQKMILQNEKLNNNILKELKLERPGELEFLRMVTSELEDQNLASEVLSEILWKYKINED